MEVTLFACLLAVVFLIALNGFLNGVFKRQIDTVLGAAWLCILGALLYWFDWKGLGMGVALSFIGGGLLYSFARKVAAFLYSITRS
jgi:hypothetical protein